MSRELSIFSGRIHEGLSADICRHLGVPLGQRQLFNFANGNTFVKYEEICRERDIFIVQPGVSSDTFSVNDALMETYIMIDAARRASAWRVTAVVPYLAYGRTDKTDQSRVPITARLVADFYTSAGIDRVLLVDLHAGQIQGFFPSSIGVDEVTAFCPIVDYVKSKNLSDLVVVAADLGIAKKAKNFATALGCPLAVVNKERLGNEDKTVAKELVGSVSGCNALVVDDEIDTGGSLVGAVQICADHGARDIFAAVTHGLFSGPAIERVNASPMRELIVTDTVPQDARGRLSPKVRVIPIAPLLAETIRRIHYGESVGDVYSDLYPQCVLGA